MSDTVFKRVNYALCSLAKFIFEVTHHFYTSSTGAIKI